MKIPKRCQIFDREVQIDDKDAERLRPYLAHWGKLNRLFLDGTNELDLQRLVVLELLGKGRAEILRRLFGRITRVQHRRWVKTAGEWWV